MIGKRSRQGCEECRKRRRKCDEAKPICGPCSSYHRTCNYTLKLIWGGRPMGAAAGLQGRSGTGASAGTGAGTGMGVFASGSGGSSSSSSSNVVGTTRKRGDSLMRAIPQQVGRLEQLQRLQRPAQGDVKTKATTTMAGGQITPADQDERGQQDDDGDSTVATLDAVTASATTTTAAATAAATTTATSTALTLPPTLNAAPPCLPNGVPLSPPYQRLLDYFTQDILASLSVHPSIHQDLCQGLVPTMLHSPHLLSAGLALSAAGLVSRGLSNVAGVDITRVIEHLQLSGLALLRQALQRGMRNSVVMATCLLWCLADVFAAGSDPDAATLGTPSATSLTILESVTSRQHSSKSSSSSKDSSSASSGSTGPAAASSSSSWRIHLQGIKALLGGDQAFDTFVISAGSSRSAMRHLYLLYLSLQTLPYVPPAGNVQRLLPSSASSSAATLRPPQPHTVFPMDEFMPAINGDDGSAGGDAPPRIDGFLGYSEELLDILQEIDTIANMPPDTLPTDAAETKQPEQGGDAGTHAHAPTPTPTPTIPLSGAALAAANVLLGKAQGLILRDAATALPVMIAEPELSAASRREFVLCHRCFQQATLIHLYRRLFRLPSYSAPIQEAVAQIHLMAGQMTQGAPCSTWVAMSMPLFTVGCEAFTPAQQAWSHASLDTLAASIGSMHVRVVRQALEDVWRLRARRGDTDGRLCAGQLLDELNYNIILF